MKVTETKEITTSQSGKVQCVEGKLVLIRVPALTSELPVNAVDISAENSVLALYVQPIIISETEKILKADSVLIGNSIYYCYMENNTDSVWLRTPNGFQKLIGNKEYPKILALPEQFTQKQLQAIVDGKMKDGDKVLVECDYGRLGDIKELGGIVNGYKIKQPLTLHEAREKSI